MAARGGGCEGWWWRGGGTSAGVAPYPRARATRVRRRARFPDELLDGVDGGEGGGRGGGVSLGRARHPTRPRNEGAEGASPAPPCIGTAPRRPSRRPVCFVLPSSLCCRGGSARYAYPQPDGYGHAHHAAFRPSPAAPRQRQHFPPRSGSDNFPFSRDFSQSCAGSSHVIRLRKVSDSVCIPCGARPEAFPATPSVPLTALGTTLALVGIRDVLHLPSAASVAPFSLSPLALYAFAGRRHPPLSSCPSLSVCRVPLWFLIFSWAAALLPPAGHGAPPLHPPLRDICVVSGSWVRNPRPVTVLPLP